MPILQKQEDEKESACSEKSESECDEDEADTSPPIRLGGTAWLELPLANETKHWAKYRPHVAAVAGEWGRPT
eukprot:scaffold7003_cov106-Skeletonema_dohrnii-CCMP3373.AAC.4